MASSSYIRSLFSTSSLTAPELETFYFNPPFKQVRAADSAGTGSLRGYHQGSINDLPPEGQPIFELQKKDFKRVTKVKIFIPDESELIRIDDNLAAFEAQPIPTYIVTGSDNIFNIEFTTLSNTADYIYYWDRYNDAKSIQIRPGDTEELEISGTYIASTNNYSSEAPDTPRNLGTNWNGQPWSSIFGITKTYGTIISSSQYFHTP